MFQSIGTVNRRQMLRWCIVPLVYAVMLNTTFLTMRHLTLSLVTVFRNLTPFATILIETVVMPHEHQPVITGTTFLALLMMLAGCLMYSQGNLAVTHIGLAVVTVNMVFVVIERILERRLLVSECKDP